MALTIIWSDEAKHNLQKTIDYLTEHWSEKELKAFAKMLDKQLSIIRDKPETYKKSERLLGARECLLTKHNSLLYISTKKYLYIVTLWDNRQNPVKLSGKDK